MLQYAIDCLVIAIVIILMTLKLASVGVCLHNVLPCCRFLSLDIVVISYNGSERLMRGHRWHLMLLLLILLISLQ